MPITAENDIQLTDSRETETSVLQPPGNDYFCLEWAWKQTFLQNLQIWAQAGRTLIWVLWDSSGAEDPAESTGASDLPNY